MGSAYGWGKPKRRRLGPALGTKVDGEGLGVG